MAALASSAGSVPECPGCSTRMLISLREGFYSTFCCEGCGNDGIEGESWFCKDCQMDYCFECKPKPVEPKGKAVACVSCEKPTTFTDERPYETFCCEMCGNDGIEGKSWFCGDCQTDICTDCAPSPGEKKPAPKCSSCSKETKFTDERPYETFCCEICGNDGIEGKSWFCGDCQTDVCTDCEKEAA